MPLDTPTRQDMAGLRLALSAAQRSPLGPNPRVGAAVLDIDGTPVAVAHHRGAGTSHAEMAALQAGREILPAEDLAACTVAVTLEPCSHRGRTPACVEALLQADIRRVVIAHPDPTERASGGADLLEHAGVCVVRPEQLPAELTTEASWLVERWTRACHEQRPTVTAKIAVSLDGCVAAADGSSRWITSPMARTDTHLLRAQADAVLIGTGTLIADNPQLTVRFLPDTATTAPAPDGLNVSGTDDGGGIHPDEPSDPLRVIVGAQSVPVDASVRGSDGRFRHFATRDLAAALGQLAVGDLVEHVLVEPGPMLLAGCLEADLVDELVIYQAPLLLGPGRSATAQLDVPTLTQARRLSPVGPARPLGPDLRFAFTPAPTGD